MKHLQVAGALIFENGKVFATKQAFDLADRGARILLFSVPAPGATFDMPLIDVFKKELDALIKYLDGKGGAKIIVTTGFWKHPGDKQIRALTDEAGYDLVELGDLGEDDKMKAIGLFEHSGVANHPGDEGMKAIAERISAVLEKYI